MHPLILSTKIYPCSKYTFYLHGVTNYTNLTHPFILHVTTNYYTQYIVAQTDYIATHSIHKLPLFTPTNYSISYTRY